jgi:cell division protein FtsB
VADGLKKPVTALILILFLILFGLSLFPGFLRIGNLQNRSQGLEQELLRLRAENKRLETELRLLRDDPVYIEKIARQQLNKAKQGEIVYKVVRESQPRDQAGS